MILDLLMSCNYIQFCFTCFETMLLDTYKLIFTSFWWIKNYHYDKISVSLFFLKDIFSDTKGYTNFFFICIFHLLTSNCLVYYIFNLLSCREHIVSL